MTQALVELVLLLHCPLQHAQLALLVEPAVDFARVHVHVHACLPQQLAQQLLQQRLVLQPGSSAHAVAGFWAVYAHLKAVFT